MSAIRTIHAICQKNGIDETARRAIYARVTGKSSAGDMSEAERKSVVAHMNQKYGNRYPSRKGSSKPYVRLIFALWKSVHEKGVVEDGSKTALRSFVKNKTGKDDPEFLTYSEATPVIEALKAMEKRGTTHA